MKATELLEAETLPHKTYCLTGDDDLLKYLVTQRVAQLTQNEKANTERTEADTALEAATQLSEPSLFGRRLLIIELKKWGNTKPLADALREAETSDDVTLIRAEKIPDTLKTLPEIDCKKPTHAKTREKLITIRANHYGLTLDDEVKKTLRERTTSTAELEAALRTLSFSQRKKTTTKDAEEATQEPPARRDIQRALLKKNLPRLYKELHAGEPIYILTIFHNNLFKLYTFLELTTREGGEERATELLEIPPRALKDWRAAKMKYASKTIREIMTSVTEAYDDVRSGKEDWAEKLHYALGKLAN